MAVNEPFQSTTYQVGRIIKALSSDVDGNLIFQDVPNPNGTTLTQLLESTNSEYINFNPSNSFFSNVSTVADALRYLNLFAYIKDTGRFLLVDQTIPNENVIDGEIYNDIRDAIQWINGQVLNGYNIFNILLMGSHKQQGVLEQSSDIGVYEIDASSSLSPIIINKNGIKVIGIGNPVIRVKNSSGTSSNRNSIFQIDTDGVQNKINVSFSNVSFEFVNSVYTSIFLVKDAPINNTTKERNGFELINTSVSFKTGTNKRNRLVEINNPTSIYPAQITIKDLKIGTITNTTPSSEEIELIYLNHNEKTVVTLKDINLGLAEQPNPVENNDNTQTTSFTGIVAYYGTVELDSITLDEKFYWNGSIFTDVITLLLKAYNYSKISMSNVGIIRNSYNTINQNLGGITTIKDWIQVDSTANVNIDGFDSYISVDVTSIQSISPSGIGTSGTSGTPTSGTSGTSGTPGDVKPIKSFFSNDKFAFGIGHTGELRLGQLKNAEIADFSKYTLNYGVPFWYNSDSKSMQYWDGTHIITLESNGGIASTRTYFVTLTEPMFTPTSYAFSGEATFLGFEYNIQHFLQLSDKNAYTISIIDTVTGRKIEPQEVISIDTNTLKIIMTTPLNVTVSIIGF